MKRTLPSNRSIVAIAFVLLVLPFGAAQAATSDDDGVRVRIEWWASEYDRESGTHSGLSPRGEGDVALRAGETGLLSVGVGSFDSPGSSQAVFVSCGNARTISDPDAWREELLERAPTAWWIEATARRSDAGSLALDLEWERLESTAPGAPVVAARGSRTITVGGDQPHLLDFLPAEGRSGGMVQIRAEHSRQTPATAEVLRYEIWYRFNPGSGPGRSRKLRLVGNSAEEVDYRFLPFRFKVHDAATGRDDMREIIVDLSGSVRGRLLADGRIEVTLEAVRDVESRRAGSPGGNFRHGGTKAFIASPGEAISLELPPLQGSAGYTNSFMANQAEFFAGSSDTIILTVEPER